MKHLAHRICKTRQEFDSSKFLSDAEYLIDRDQQEPNDRMGQKVGKVFHLADFFVDVDHGMEVAVKRLVELFLGNVFITPTRSEQGMFLAHASAWRSASLQRQVGAMIATKDGSVISVGTNEVPKTGGGLYWEGDDPDFRDFQRGDEVNDDMKNRMFVQPYPKSLVNELYPDSIRIEDGECGAFVNFVPFVGVATRRYQDVFKVGEIDRKPQIKYANDWKAEVANPRLGEYPSRTQKINIVTEKAAFDEFSRDFERVTNGNNQT